MADEVEIEEAPRGLIRRTAEALAQRAGAVVVDEPEMELMEAQVEDRRVLRKQLDLIAWQSLDYIGGSEQDMHAVARRELVQQARVAWQQDPQLGAATDLMNDFTLGRGVPKPKAMDPEVQKILDDAWDDEDNQRVLTTYAAQLALGTDLSIQSNVFVLMFTGVDGKVKLSLLDHDAVEDIVRDEDDRRKVLYYKVRQRKIKWDFATDQAKPERESLDVGKDRFKYHAHWRNEAPVGQRCPAEKLGKGVVYHVAINRTSEMGFGHPTMHRTLRWATSFNQLMEAQVDAAKAAAAFMMKRKVKGTPNQVRKLATQALTRSGELGRSDRLDPESNYPDGTRVGPRSGSILNENEGVEHESFKLDSGAQNANVSGQMIRSQISAATHFPQHYLGDIGSANLATATSMELPVLKAVESRQEVLEQLFRWFIDRVIEEALEKGLLKEDLTPEEWAEQKLDEDEEGRENQPATTAPESTDLGGQPEVDTDAADEEIPEDERKRDLAYDFGLPSPLRRMMTDLVNSVATIARTFDPNGTNIELTRTLFSICMGEGLEVNDPAETTEKIFPPGYTDPAMEALQAAQQAPPGGPPNLGGGAPPPGMVFQPTDPAAQNGNGNGAAPFGATTPEETPYGVTEAALQAQGGVLLDPEAPRQYVTREEALQALQEAGISDRLPAEARDRLRRRLATAEGELGDVFTELLDIAAPPR